MSLRCLSLTQPYASLIILGAKRYETRSWSTKFRGMLGIHASKGFPGDAAVLCEVEPFFSSLGRAGYGSWRSLPCGALLGTLQLVDCVPVEYVRPTISSEEYAFGNYTSGRWAWKLEDPRLFKEPIPMKGALQIWAWVYEGVLPWSN